MPKKSQINEYSDGQSCAIFAGLKIVQLIHTWGCRFVSMDSLCVLHIHLLHTISHALCIIHPHVKGINIWRIFQSKELSSTEDMCLSRELRSLFFRNFNMGKHLSSSFIPRTWTTAISTSFTYSIIKWIRRQLAFIVLHKWVKGFTLKGCKSQHTMTLWSTWRSTKKTKGGWVCLIWSILCIGSRNFVPSHCTGHTKTRAGKNILLEVVCNHGLWVWHIFSHLRGGKKLIQWRSWSYLNPIWANKTKKNSTTMVFSLPLYSTYTLTKGPYCLNVAYTNRTF